jgi:hypothetical protein
MNSTCPREQAEGKKTFTSRSCLADSPSGVESGAPAFVPGIWPIGFLIRTKAPVTVHDVPATVLHALGLDHRKLVTRYQGRDFRLTDVAERVVKALLA